MKTAKKTPLLKGKEKPKVGSKHSKVLLSKDMPLKRNPMISKETKKK